MPTPARGTMTLTVPRDTEQAESEPIEPQSEPSAEPAAQPAAREPWWTLTALVVLAGISGGAYYIGFVRPYLLSTYFKTPLLDLAKISGHTAASANSWALTWIVLFACYY